MDKVKRNPNLPLHRYISMHPQKRLKSRHPIWDLTIPTEAYVETWKTRWRDSGVRGAALIENPETRVPGFGLPRKIWSALNRARTEQGRCKSLLYKWGMEQSPLCSCGAEQTIRHIIDACPNTKFEGGIAKLHEAGTEAVEWITSLESPL